ncbi:MAG TPA: ABC transporter permease [Actinomycetota bacterium]|nr:ABC transporter permease [Actinomycetota bacterium]
MTSLATIRLVARREVVQRARSRAFKISTAIVVLVAVALIVVPSFVSGGRPTSTVGVVGGASSELASSLVAVGKAQDRTVEVSAYPDEAAAERALRAGAVDVVLVPDRAQLVWKAERDPVVAALVTEAVQAIERGRTIAEIGLTPEQAAALLRPPGLSSRSLEPVGKEEEGRIALATIVVILLFASISVFGGFLVSGVIEEKANRVVEVLLSRVRPDELLAGKVLGMGVVGLAQILVVAVAVLGALVAVGTADLPQTTPGMVGWVLLWFVVGYGFYSVVFATSGSLASRQEDAQSVSVPVTMLSLVAYFVSLGTISDPSGTLARVCSFLPPTAPFVMVARQARGGVSVWEVAVSVAVMAASTYGLVKLAGRIYEGAILRIGPRVRLREAWRSARR